MLRVLKYGTGHEIPKGAVYLSTITEDMTRQECYGHCTHRPSCPELRTFIEDRLVWHYFLVECDEKGNPPPTRELPAS